MLRCTGHKIGAQKKGRGHENVKSRTKNALHFEDSFVLCVLVCGLLCFRYAMVTFATTAGTTTLGLRSHALSHL